MTPIPHKARIRARGPPGMPGGTGQPPLASPPDELTVAPTQRNIAVLGDGFTAADQAAYNQWVQTVLRAWSG
jgi:hypothetical protein